MKNKTFRYIAIITLAVLILFAAGCSKSPSGEGDALMDASSRQETAETGQNNPPTFGSRQDGQEIHAQNEMETPAEKSPNSTSHEAAQSQTTQTNANFTTTPKFTTLQELSKYMKTMGFIELESDREIFDKALEHANKASVLQHIYHQVQIDCKAIAETAKKWSPDAEIGDEESCERMNNMMKNESFRNNTFNSPSLPSGFHLARLMESPKIAYCGRQNQCIVWAAILANDWDFCLESTEFDACVLAVSIYHKDTKFCDLAPDSIEEKITCLRIFNINGQLDETIYELKSGQN